MSEGTSSARRINGALAGDPYLMRVDTAQMQAPLRQVAGDVDEASAYDLRGVDYEDEYDSGTEMLGYALLFFVAVCIVAALAAFVWVLQQ